MTTDRIKEIQETTPYPENHSVQQALLQVWNECEQQKKSYSEEDMINFAFDTYCYISGIMKVPFHQISENKLHAMYNFEQFKKDLK
jgi:D-hexose-6-phosphate mutarotase